jgi:hypothetical protein
MRFYDEDGVEIGGLGFEFADRILHYIQTEDTTFAKICFYVAVFTMPLWFTVITAAGAIRGTYRLSKWLWRSVSWAYHSTMEERRLRKRQHC